MEKFKNPERYFGRDRMKNPDKLEDALRNAMSVEGQVHWIAENPPETEMKFINGLYRMEDVTGNVVCDGLYPILTLHMIAGAAAATDAIDELHLGDDTSQPIRSDTGPGNEINSQGDLPNETGMTGTQDTTSSANDTFILANTWTNIGSNEHVGEVCAMAQGGTACAGHSAFVGVGGATIEISGSSGTLTINYKFIFAPA